MFQEQIFHVCLFKHSNNIISARIAFLRKVKDGGNIVPKHTQFIKVYSNKESLTRQNSV